MKKPLAFKLLVDPKNVRRTVALLTGDVISDEELEKKFFDREDIEIECPEGWYEMTAAFVALMYLADIEAEEGPKSESKFDKKMRELMEKSKPIKEL